MRKANYRTPGAIKGTVCCGCLDVGECLFPTSSWLTVTKNVKNVWSGPGNNPESLSMFFLWLHLNLKWIAAKWMVIVVFMDLENFYYMEVWYVIKAWIAKNFVILQWHLKPKTPVHEGWPFWQSWGLPQTDKQWCY